MTGSSACASVVARDDPHLHATALFAPEPGRSRLMVLYAFDVELSRAAMASSEPLIARMRLQWWRDVAAAARAGAPPPAHEVAGPFARLAARDLPAGPAEALIGAMFDARDAELAGGIAEDASGARFADWADGRFGALTALASGLLTRGDAEAEAAASAFARRAGPILGTAFALRHAAAMAAADRFLLPGLPGLAAADRSALARGALTPAGRETVRQLAASALADLAAMRAARGGIDRRATPALLPLARAGRVLRWAERVASDLRAGEDDAADRPGLADLGEAERPFEGLRLAWAAATGAW